MHESDFITAVNKLLPQAIYRWKIHDSFTSGIPDAYYSGTKSDLWVEYKLLRTTPNKHTPKLTELQKNWLKAQYERGRNVIVIIGFKGGKGFIAEDLTWEKQLNITDLKSKQELANWIEKKVS